MKNDDYDQRDRNAARWGLPKAEKGTAKPCPLCQDIDQMTGNPDDYEMCGLCQTAVDQLVAEHLPRRADDAERDLSE